MRARGFTLIELIVATAIFALVSVMAYGGLRAVLASGAAADAEAERLSALQRAFTLIASDFAQAVPRPVRDALRDQVPAMLTKVDSVRFTRAGMPNPLSLRRSTLIRVGYGAGKGGTLVRYRWPVLDRAIQQEPARSVLLTGVRELRFRFFYQGKWLEFWPPVEADPPALPRAVTVELELADYGEVRRLIALPGSP
ncbi:MAG: type II secretion system minor pseudopilin GspJ [Nitrococcus sp.]|nr:type II secretion system minor pseudopilin GspJ [Nitrococcus sp.]